MDDNQLFQRAIKASYAYRDIYGVFPHKIGIHHERFRTFKHQYIVFPDIPEIDIRMIMNEAPEPCFGLFTAPFKDVFGKSVHWNEVYFSRFPGEESRLISADMVMQEKMIRGTWIYWQ